MAQVEIVSESESTSCWVFDVQILHDDGSLSRHSARLAWADYNLWSADGSDSPGRVVEAAIMVLLEQITAPDLPKSFDVSIARRRCPDADDRIPRSIRA